MIFDEKTRMFIESVCEDVSQEQDYDLFIQKVTEYVDRYGEQNGLDGYSMDAIENEILIILER